MKRIKLAIIILLILSLTGCVNKSTANDQQANAIAEYMAGLLLDYDDDYDQKLISNEDSAGDITDDTEITKTPAQNGSVDNITGTADSNNAQVDNSISISEVIGKKNFDIKYKSYKITDTYPEDSDNALFYLNHSKGYKLLVVTFSIKNKSDSKQTLNLSDENIDYQLTINSEASYSPLLTLLENNLKYIDMKINAGKTEKSILIFEIPEKTDTSNMTLTVANNGKATSIEVK